MKRNKNQSSIIPSPAVVLQSARRPSVMSSHCRGPVICCCWSQDLEQSPWRPEHVSGAGLVSISTQRSHFQLPASSFLYLFTSFRNPRSPLRSRSTALFSIAAPADPIFWPSPLHFPLPLRSHALLATSLRLVRCQFSSVNWRLTCFDILPRHCVMHSGS